MLNRQYHPFRILLAYSLVAAALYAAQLIPYTGVFLMMLGGALWISILLNLMLVHIAIAALQRRIPRIWLALPGVIYGTWLIIFAVQSLKTSKEIASLNAANEILSPIPENVDLIFDQNDPLAIDAKKYIIGSRVFAGEFEVAVSHGTKPDGCFSLTDPAAGERSFGYFNTTPDYDSRGTCIITKVSHSPRSGLRIQKTLEPFSTNFFPEEHFAYSLKQLNADGTTIDIGQFHSGLLSSMSPIPLFLLGCALNSAAPSWFCFFMPIPHWVYYGVSQQPSMMAASLERSERRVQALAALLNRQVRVRTKGW